MRQILEIEEHVGVPPIMYADPFYRITYLSKEEIRKHKWIEGEKGRALSIVSEFGSVPDLYFSGSM